MYTIIDEYKYLYDILFGLIKGNFDGVADEYNLSGARKSGKTVSALILIRDCFLAAIEHNKKFGFVMTRDLAKDVKDLNAEFQEILYGVENGDALHQFVEYRFSSNAPSYKYPQQLLNKSRGLIRGLHNKSETKVSLKGLPSFKDFDLVIKFIEEANEVDRPSRQALDMAVRGAKHVITITACNPDRLNNYHISYLHRRHRFDLKKLKKYSRQFKVVKENEIKKVFHYTNWRVNHFLTRQEQNELLELEKLDPEKAKVWSFGYPGSVSESVFTRYITSAQGSLTFEPYIYTGGVDLGFADAPTGHATAASLWVLNSKSNRAHKIKEFFHSNAEMSYLNPRQIHIAIVEFYQQCAKIYTKIQYHGMQINVDYGAGGLVSIDALKNICISKGIDYLNFVPVDKQNYYVIDRVEFFTSCISSGIMTFNWNLLPFSHRQYELMVYKVDENVISDKIEIVPLNDDCFDSDCYALMPYMKAIIDNNDINFILFKKNSQFISDTLKGRKEWDEKDKPD